LKPQHPSPAPAKAAAPGPSEDVSMARKPRRLAFAPRLEAVEPRTLLAGSIAPIGANVDFNSPFNAPSKVFVNIKNQMDIGNIESVRLSAEGYPLDPTEIFAQISETYPDGVYRVSYKGQADFAFANGARLLSGDDVVDDGVTRLEVAFDHTQGNGAFSILVSGQDASDPFTDLRIIPPGYDAATARIFTDEFLDSFKGFESIRFLNWERTNTPSGGWSERTLPVGFQANARPMAWEYMIDLANETGKDPWINIPDRADDDYVRNLAALFRDRLRPDLTVHVEYSNEVWNFGFPQYYRVLADAKANPLIDADGDWYRAAQQSAFKLMNFSAIFREEFGPRAAQVAPVFGGFYYAGWTEAGLDFINSKYGTPSRYFAAASVAEYVDLFEGTDVQGLTMDGLFASLDRYLNENVLPSIQANRAVTARYGLPLFAYEGGQGMSNLNNVNGELKEAAQEDPRMGALYERLMNAWTQYGGGLFMHFSHINIDSKWGYWGLLNNVNEPGSRKWDALMRLSHDPGDATLDGAVDHADFAVLKANYKAGGPRWWRQGDSNADNAVDAVDLERLRANVRGLSGPQAAEVALFDAPTVGTVGNAVAFDNGGRNDGLTYRWNVARDGSVVASGTQAAFAFTPDAGGTYVVRLDTNDQAGRAGSGVVNVVVAGQGPPPATGAAIILDDRAPGYSEVGAWQGWDSGYGGHHRFAQGSDKAATWALPALADGDYLVQATWEAPHHRKAIFRVYDGDTLLRELTVDQSVEPRPDTSEGGRPFQTLATIRVAQGSRVRVVIEATDQGLANADAIRIAPAGAAAPPPPTVSTIILDDRAAGYSEVGNWQGWGSGYGGNHRFAQGNGNAATWAVPTLADGDYLVQATWEAPHHRKAIFRVYDGDTLLRELTVDQSVEPRPDTSEGGRPFQTLATIRVAQGSRVRVVIEATDQGLANADAIRIAKLS